MLAVLIVAIPLGWKVNSAREQRAIVDAIRRYGGWVHFDYEYVKGNLVRGRSPWAPRWIREAIGDEYFQEVKEVNFAYDAVSPRRWIHNPNTHVCDQILKKVARLPGVKRLVLKKRQATDNGLKYVAMMSKLEDLSIMDAYAITDVGVSHLTALRKLRRVQISFGHLTDSSLVLLSGLPHVRELVLQGNSFTDRGLAALQGHERLEKLCIGIGAAGITDVGMSHLAKFEKLVELELQQSKVTIAGLAQLKELPNLKGVRLRARGFDPGMQAMLEAPRESRPAVSPREGL